MAFVNERLTTQQKMDFKNRQIKNPISGKAACLRCRTSGYPEFGITRVIPKKRISRKSEKNRVVKGKYFEKFGIKF